MRKLVGGQLRERVKDSDTGKRTRSRKGGSAGKEAEGIAAAAAAAKSLQSCPTLCDPKDGSSRGSPVPGILQARTLERVAISFSSA